MKNKLNYIIFIIILFTGCKMISPELGYKMKVKNKYYFPLQSDEYTKKVSDCIELKQFPCNEDEPQDTLSKFQNEWYSKHLYSLTEPILYNRTNENLQILRYTNLGTWSHPYSYRIEIKDSIGIIIYKETNGQGGYEAGSIIKNKKKKISFEEWNLLTQKMDEINFWNIPTHDPNLILDGEEWIFEALINDQYHFVTRNSPDVYDGKKYAELCLLMENIFKK